MIIHIESPSIIRIFYSSIFKNVLAYSGILMHIQPHSKSCNEGEKGAFPALFKNQKKYPDFAKKGPDFVHFWVKSD